MRPMICPRYMVERPLAGGQIGYFWYPRTADIKAGCPLKGGSLGSDQSKAALGSVNGVTDRAKLAFFVDNMPGRDSLALRDKMKTVQPGIDMTQLFECDSCDHSEEVQIPISIEFFWPSAR